MKLSNGWDPELLSMNISDYKSLFEAEAKEALEALETGVLGLECGDGGSSCIDELFRHAHNLKGISGAMGYDSVVEASHAIENVLDGVRSGRIAISADETDVLLRAVDLLHVLVKQALNEEEDESGENLLQEVIRILEPSVERAAGTCREETAACHPGVQAGVTVPTFGERSVSSVTTTRVDLETLDRLMDIVGELIISRIRLGGIASGIGSKPLLDELVSSGRLISKIQKEVMETRLIPVGQVFQRFKRLVRDTARETGKQVHLEIRGAEIGLDRTVIESIADPLMHVIRNAVHHGVETPGERLAAGKLELATIILNARRERNFVTLEVSDDGRGIDMKQVLKLGKERDLVPPSMRELNEEDLCRILAAPGFSTSEDVDSISGRGVGMNIVKKAIDSLGGSMRIRSEQGEGTTVTLHLPTNLSIIKALLFYLGREVHAIPIEYVRETTRVESGSFKSVQGREVHATKKGAIPIIKPWEVFGLAPDREHTRFVKIIIIDTGSGEIGLVINHIIGQQDVVIKGLPVLIRGINGISGATILGSGEIAFIWDPTVLFKGRLLHELDREAIVS